MSYVNRIAVTVTTAADGTATSYSEVAMGLLSSVSYVKTDFADGVDFTITTETTGQNVWTDTNINASEVVNPRAATHDATGAASLYAAAGEPVEDYIPIANERIKIVIAQGGNVKTGTFYFVLI